MSHISTGPMGSANQPIDESKKTVPKSEAEKKEAHPKNHGPKRESAQAARKLAKQEVAFSQTSKNKALANYLSYETESTSKLDEPPKPTEVSSLLSELSDLIGISSVATSSAEIKLISMDINEVDEAIKALDEQIKEMSERIEEISAIPQSDLSDADRAEVLDSLAKNQELIVRKKEPFVRKKQELENQLILHLSALVESASVTEKTEVSLLKPIQAAPSVPAPEVSFATTLETVDIPDSLLAFSLVADPAALLLIGNNYRKSKGRLTELQARLEQLKKRSPSETKEIESLENQIQNELLSISGQKIAALQKLGRIAASVTEVVSKVSPAPSVAAAATSTVTAAPSPISAIVGTATSLVQLRETMKRSERIDAEIEKLDSQIKLTDQDSALYPILKMRWQNLQFQKQDNMVNKFKYATQAASGVVSALTVKGAIGVAAAGTASAAVGHVMIPAIPVVVAAGGASYVAYKQRHFLKYAADSVYYGAASSVTGLKARVSGYQESSLKESISAPFKAEKESVHKETHALLNKKIADVKKRISDYERRISFIETTIRQEGDIGSEKSDEIKKIRDQIDLLKTELAEKSNEFYAAYKGKMAPIESRHKEALSSNPSLQLASGKVASVSLEIERQKSEELKRLEAFESSKLYNQVTGVTYDEVVVFRDYLASQLKDPHALEEVSAFLNGNMIDAKPPVSQRVSAYLTKVI